MLAAAPVFAAPQWIKARIGSFEAISDDGRKPALQALSQFEQFSFALGTVLGKPELKLDPPLRIIVFKTQQELTAQCPAPPPTSLRTGRDRLMTCTTPEGQLPPELLRELTRKLLEGNFSSMPGNVERGIETFFSTVQSTGVHVTWGTPPPVAERTRDWALLHMILTLPYYSNKAKIYLHNLAGGMDKSGASRNAFGDDAATFDDDVDRYFAAGVFSSGTGPNRGLNPERDFTTSAMTSDEGELMRADLLTPGSEAAYKSLLKAGKHATEADEGLALLAMRANDLRTARSYMTDARRAGTKNFILLTAFAEKETDSDEAIDIVKEALTLDPKYAQAHWVFGEKLRDARRRMAEWKQAVDLAPGNGVWLGQYAQLCMDQKQYAEAGRAWMAASIAAPDTATRDRYLRLRSEIDTQRLEAEDAERREDAAVKARELEKLKNEAKQHLADLEARAGGKPLSADPPHPTVDWFDADSDDKLAGTLVRVTCTGKQLRLEVKDDAGKTQNLQVSDTAQLTIQGGDGTLTCGAQKPRHVEVAYRKPKDAKGGVLGEATGIEFAP